MLPCYSVTYHVLQGSAIEEEVAELHRGNSGLRCEDAEYKFLEVG